jgi:hypothetical protein
MESKNILAATSLFCSQRNWPLLLKAIDNFNKTIYKKSSFCLEFNYLSGENVRFSFLTQKKTAEGLLKHTDEYFKDFFCRLKPEIQKQSGEIFKSFEQNNIYYGLYNPAAISKVEEKNYTLQFTLSKLIVAALKDEDYLNDEIILTLAYYFAITFIKVAIKKFKVHKKVFTVYFRDQYHSLETLEHKVIDAKFKENKPILLEIYRSIGEKDSPRWIEKWEATLLELMQNNETEPALKTAQVFQYIGTQLGLNNAMKSMLFYFIFQILLVKNL